MFSFKNDLEKQHFGFIAQELQQTLYNNIGENENYALVMKDPITDYYKVNYNEMTALNAAQIKNLMIQLNQLETKYKQLETKYNQLLRNNTDEIS
jgi:hypothetical protein